MTVITPDSKLDAGDLNGLAKAKELAKGIARNFDGQGDNGTILVYNPTDNTWTAPFAEYSSPTNSQPTKFGAPLILIDNWSVNSDAESSGFAEAAADNFFAALVSLNQSYTGNIKDALLESPLHFIGHGRGAVVNSEVIQRLGTYFPHAGGVYRDPDTKKVLRGDLQMTTIDVHDFAQLNQVNYFDPQVRVWDNVTFADNYYQTTAADKFEGRKLENNIPPGWLDLNNSILSRADVNVDLSGYAGFTIEDLANGKDPHNNALAWYAGTADVSLDENNPAFGTRIFRRKGDFSQKVFYDGTTYVPWYTNNLSPIDATSSQFNAVSHGDPDGQWEGVGTGWYYSAIGGGYSRRGSLPVNTTPRTPIGYDNSAKPSQRGDYAVPTLFNGNFDVTTISQPVTLVPSWSGINQGNLETWTQLLPGSSPDLSVYAATASNNYALKLNSGQTITHNDFVVPDWGNLRFDVFAPVNSGQLTVSIESEELTTPIQTIIDIGTDATIPFDSKNNIDLAAIPGNTTYQKITNIYRQTETQIGYGRTGFETFQLKLDSAAAMSLRGKSAKVTFSMNNGSYVYLDNIFFKSNNLSLGNITEARWDTTSTGQYGNNLLLEKPQYVVSYNENRKSVNWSAWKLDRTWLSQNSLQRRLGTEFIGDPNLPNPNLPNGFDKYNGNAFLGLRMDRGHITPDSNRNRSSKDQLSTYFSTNVIAQATDNNRFYVDGANDPTKASAWYNLEQRLKNEVIGVNQQYYIIAGAFGDNPAAQKASNVPDILDDPFYQGNTSPNILNTRGIKIPVATWKVVVTLNNNGEPVNVEAYITPNRAEPQSFPIGGVTHPFNNLGIYRPNITSITAWRNPDTWRINLSQLQVFLNRQSIPPTTLIPNDLPEFDFNTRYNLTALDISAPLLADILEGNGIIGVGQSAVNFRDGGFSPYSPKVRDNFLIQGVYECNFEAPLSPITSTANVRRKNRATTAPFSFSEIASLENHLIKVGSNDSTESPITISKACAEETTSHHSILQIAPSEGWHITKFPDAVGEIAVNKLINKGDIEVTRDAIFFVRNISENSSREVNSFQLNSISIQPDIRQNNVGKGSFPSVVPSQQLFSSDLSTLGHINTSLLTSIYSTAQSIWHSNTAIDLNFTITNLPTGQLAEGTINSYNPNGTPKTATITIDDDANGVGWFIDTTPQDNSEFTGVNNYLQAAPNSTASGKYDLLTAILHEMGHTLGIINGYNEFDKHIKNNQFIPTDSPTGAKITLTPDGSHLDSTLYPYDLMNTSLKPGIRKLPSTMDFSILNALWS